MGLESRSRSAAGGFCHLSVSSSKNRLISLPQIYFSGTLALLFFLHSHQVFMHESSVPIRFSPDHLSQQYCNDLQENNEMLFCVWIGHAAN